MNIPLADKLLELAAGCPVNVEAFYRNSLNFPKLKVMAKAYKSGWLDNVLARVTPLTTYDLTDYLVMADVFVVDANQAHELLGKMSRDLNAFAVAAGVNPCTGESEMLNKHKALYDSVAGLLADKFGFSAPAPFACAVMDDLAQKNVMFARRFLDAETCVPVWLNADPAY